MPPGMGRRKSPNKPNNIQLVINAAVGFKNTALQILRDQAAEAGSGCYYGFTRATCTLTAQQNESKVLALISDDITNNISLPTDGSIPHIESALVMFRAVSSGGNSTMDINKFHCWMVSAPPTATFTDNTESSTNFPACLDDCLNLAYNLEASGEFHDRIVGVKSDLTAAMLEGEFSLDITKTARSLLKRRIENVYSGDSLPKVWAGITMSSYTGNTIFLTCRAEYRWSFLNGKVPV